MRRVDAPTSFTDVMTLAETGERTFFNMHGADSLLQPGDVDAASLGCDIFHLGYLLLLDGMDGEDGEFGTAAAANLAAPDSISGAMSLADTLELERRFARR